LFEFVTDVDDNVESLALLDCTFIGGTFNDCTSMECAGDVASREVLMVRNPWWESMERNPW
jgi:hypothetical protein